MTDYKALYEQAQKVNAELKEEINHKNQKFIEWGEENKELKEANDTFTLGAKRTIESNCKLYKENKELKEEIEKLKSNVFNADSRCNQFRVKVGYSYIHDILERVFDMDLDGYDEDPLRLMCMEDHKDFLFEECARVINNCINIKGVDEEYIYEEIESEVIDKFKDNDWIHQPYSSNVIADLIEE